MYALNLPELPPPPDDEVLAETADRGSQSHLATRSGHGKQTSVFHGQGGIKDIQKDEVRTYLRHLARIIDNHLTSSRLPLVLAGVDYLLPMFRDALRYNNVLPESIHGNTDHVGDKELHEQSKTIIKTMMSERHNQALNTFFDMSESPLASTKIVDILPAARQGRVASIFVASDSHLWGLASPEGEVLQLHPSQCTGDVDLADVAGVEAFLRGADLHFLPLKQMPSHARVAAILND